MCELEIDGEIVAGRASVEAIRAALLCLPLGVESWVTLHSRDRSLVANRTSSDSYTVLFQNERDALFCVWAEPPGHGEAGRLPSFEETLAWFGSFLRTGETPETCSVRPDGEDLVATTGLEGILRADIDAALARQRVGTPAFVRLRTTSDFSGLGIESAPQLISGPSFDVTPTTSGGVLLDRLSKTRRAGDLLFLLIQIARSLSTADRSVVIVMEDQPEEYHVALAEAILGPTALRDFAVGASGEGLTEFRANLKRYWRQPDEEPAAAESLAQSSFEF